MFRKNSGMIALLPAIIISSILIILCVCASRSFLAFLYRTTIFDEKIQSNIAAHACMLRVLAKHVQDNNYWGGEMILIGTYTCTVEVIATTTVSVFVKIGDAVSKEVVGY